MKHSVLVGDALSVLRKLPAESVQCVVTSPPYWGLRDYQTAGQLGLEYTPEEYVGKLVEVFREVRRVLRKDGTVWLNLGDSYAAGSDRAIGRLDQGRDIPRYGSSGGGAGRKTERSSTRVDMAGLKPKDLVGIPWRVAFALQADGWWLRSDIIWSKPNPMPESVTDRPTKAHEYVFLLTRSPTYYFDQEAVREPHARLWDETNVGSLAGGDRLTLAGRNDGGRSALPLPNPAGRNIRSVWTIATQPFPEAHFATFPEELAERCIKAGTSEKGCCAECGTPWERAWERVVGRGKTGRWRPSCCCGLSPITAAPETEGKYGRAVRHLKEFCAPDFPVPCTVLDPFCGSGTAGAVAVALQRDFLGIELNPAYVEMAERRIGSVAPLFATTT